MKITFTHIAIIFLVLIGLIAGNVYQWQHPEVVEVPAGTARIDSSAWVQRTAYLNRGSIIDSLKARNKKLGQKIKQSRDKIGSYTQIIGTLNLKVDSLQHRPPVRLDSLFQFAGSVSAADTIVIFHQSVSDSLFTITSRLRFAWPNLSNDLSLTQNRPLRLDVANTFNEARTRQLTYVTSTDFKDLQYRSYTQLRPNRRLPKFWIGLGSGIIGTLAGIVLLK